MAETGKYYDRHPVTGEPGRWRLFQDQGYVNLDPNAPKDVYWNPEVQRYMGMPGVRYSYDPNTGKEGDFIFLGTMGWLDLTPAEEQPDPGGVPFGGSSSPLYGLTKPEASPQQPEGDTEAGADAAVDTTDTGSFTPTVGSPVRGAFTAMTPQAPPYTPVQLPSTAPAPSVKNIDYVKLLRGRLVNSLFKDLI